MPRRQGDPFRAGIFTISGIAVALLLAIGINLSFGLPFNLSLWPLGQDYVIKGAFVDANGLGRGDDVVIGGHTVGQVTGVQGQGAVAIVTMRVQQRYTPLRQGSRARIRYSTLLAQKYIELSPAGSGSVLDSGAIIGTDSTITPVDFDQFLSALDPVTRQRLQTVIQQGGAALAGKQETINDLLSQTHGLSIESRAPLSTFHAHTEDVGRIVVNLAIVGDRLAASHQQLGDLVGSMDDVTGTMAAKDRALATLIYQLGVVMGDFDATLAGNEQNFHQTVVTLDPLVSQLDGALGIMAPQLHSTVPQFVASTVLPAEVGCCNGGAITEVDSEGNHLREFLVPCAGLDFTGKMANGSCSAAPSGSSPAPGVNAPSLQLPKLPLCIPTPPPLKPLPTPTLTPCPTISAPVPTPAPSCMPIPTPTPRVPTPTPSVCIPVPGVPLPSLAIPPLGSADWLTFIMAGGQ